MTDNNPLISVIVPVYNAEKYLHSCIDSIINQTYTNLEIIFVDDGSADNSLNICNEYANKDGRIKVFHKSNGGQSSARNVGIDVCSGRYVGFVDSDDWIELDMYEELLAAVESSDNAIAFTGLAIDADGVEKSIFNMGAEQFAGYSKMQFYEDLLLHKGDSSVCSKLFSKSVFENHRFEEGRLNEDVLFMLDIIDEFETIVFTKKIGYHYISRKGSTTQSFGKCMHDMVENAKYIRKFTISKDPCLKEQAERFEIYQNMTFLTACPFGYDYKNDVTYFEARKYVRENYFSGLKNNFLIVKDKIRLTLVFISPRAFSFLKYIRKKIFK